MGICFVCVFPVTKQGGIISPLLFNFYVNDLSVQLQKLPVVCCCGDMVGLVNYLMYADDNVLLAPSGKGIQTIIDVTDAYGNAYDIVLSITKSHVMFYDALKIGQAANIMLGDAVLSGAQTYRYTWHIITNNLSDEADMEDKMRGLCPRSFIFVLTRWRISYFRAHWPGLAMLPKWHDGDAVEFTICKCSV